MIVIDRAKLQFLLAGRVIEVDVSREYRTGRSYALGLSHRRAVCRVKVVERLELDDGWRLRVKRATEEQPRLLAANPAAMRADYTNDPKRAVRGEPEALTDGQLRDLTKYRAAVAQNGQDRSVTELRDRVMADLDEMLRTTITREQRDKIRTAKHHIGKLAS